MNLNNLYEAIIELQYELSGKHHDAEIGCLDYKVIKALAATYELQATVRAITSGYRVFCCLSWFILRCPSGIHSPRIPFRRRE